MLDYLFAGFRWYRRLRGGRWYHVRVRPVPSITFWTRHPGRAEIPEQVEDYGWTDPSREPRMTVLDAEQRLAFRRLVDRHPERVGGFREDEIIDEVRRVLELHRTARDDRRHP